MKICIIRNAEAEITTSFYRIVDAVIESGNEPILLSRKRECEKVEIVKKDYKFKRYNIDNYEINIPAKRGAGLKNIFQLKLYQFMLKKWLKNNKDKYDIIHSFDFDAGIICSKLSKKIGFRHIYHIADFYADSRNMPSKLKNILRKMEIKVIDSSDYTIICNEERFEQIKGCKQKNIEVIHNVPVLSKNIEEYLNKFNYDINKNDKIRLCYVGKLSKNRFILDVLSVVKDMENIEIDIAGVGPVEEEVKLIAKKYDNIYYYGKIDYENALKLYSKCDLMFSIYDPKVKNHKYSAPNKIYEAMILKKPIIVAKDTSMDKIVEKNNMGIVINYDRQDFEEKLKKLIDDKELMTNMGKNAAKAYDEYCWGKMKNRLVKIYNKFYTEGEIYEKS